ncbi:MAG: purine-binding chemotaxis protein CheW [Gemmatimonadetes bacterium]|nr:purine-binding chemotaxis protein CheW [Gemmatimonadota bacterium]
MAKPASPTRGSVDWAEIRRRVEAAGEAIAGGVESSPERVREVLEERARRLARPATPPPAGGTLEVITFALANEVYAIESRYVVEVFRLTELSPLPGAVPPVFGVTAWRGELLVILDLRRVLGISAATLNDLGRVIVLGEERPAFGILADAVREVATLPASEVHPAPEGVAANREYLWGVTRSATLVLNATKLLQLHG